MYLYLPTWPIDRLRRLGSVPSLCVAAPADEQPFATVAEAGGRRLLAAVNPAAAASGLAPGMPLADALSFVPALATAVPSRKPTPRHSIGSPNGASATARGPRPMAPQEIPTASR